MCNRMKNDLIDTYIRYDGSGCCNFAGLMEFSELTDHDCVHNGFLDYVLHKSFGYYMQIAKTSTEKKPPEGYEEIDLRPNAQKLLMGVIWAYQRKPWTVEHNFEKCKFHDHSDGSSCVRV